MSWNTPPVVGTTYEIRHSRKGTFVGHCTHVDGEWADFEIVKGTARAIMAYNVKERGEVVRCRDSMTYLTALAITPATN